MALDNKKDGSQGSTIHTQQLGMGFYLRGVVIASKPEKRKHWDTKEKRSLDTTYNQLKIELTDEQDSYTVMFDDRDGKEIPTNIELYKPLIIKVEFVKMERGKSPVVWGKIVRTEPEVKAAA